MTYKKVPLSVLDILAPFVKANSELYEVVKTPDALLYLKDKDKETDYYFKVLESRLNNIIQFHIDIKPISRDLTINSKTWHSSNNLKTLIEGWTNILSGYESHRHVYEDQIINGFAKEYYSDIEFVDIDSKSDEPLEIVNILKIDKFLKEITERLPEFETPDNKTFIEEIKNDISELQNHITQESKSAIAKKFAKILAKITKVGKVIAIEIIKETGKYLFKSMIEVDLGMKGLYSSGNL